MSPTLRIERAMRQSQRVMEKAAVEHRRAFTLQMREKIGVAEVALNEPYLPFALVHGELVYLRRLDKLQKRWSEIKLARIDIPGKPPKDSGIAYLEDDEGEYSEFDAFDDDDDEEDFDSELESDIDLETDRSTLELKQDFDGHRQQAFGISQYVWVGGSCPLCAPNNGEIFEWGEGDEPGDVHPNCDCSADPVTDGEGKEPEQNSTFNPTPEQLLDAALLLASLTPQGRAARLGAAAVSRLGRVGREIIRLARRNEPVSPKPTTKPNRSIEERTKNVPKDWVKIPSKKGEGFVYEKPGTRGSTYVKVQKGNPNSSQPGQRYDNVRWTRNGQSLDKNGNPVPRNSKEAHIPLEEFEFIPELFE